MMNLHDELPAVSEVSYANSLTVEGLTPFPTSKDSLANVKNNVTLTFTVTK